MARRCPPTPFVRQTGFKVDDVDCRFGILRPLSSTGMLDWADSPQIARLEGPGLIVTQIFLSAGPKLVTYRLLLGTVAESQALEGLLTSTGVLTLVWGQHSAPGGDPIVILDRVYERIADVTLMGLSNREVFLSGMVEVDSTWQLDG